MVEEEWLFCKINLQGEAEKVNTSFFPPLNMYNNYIPYIILKFNIEGQIEKGIILIRKSSCG